MQADLNTVSFFEPAGIDNRASGGSPWELLVNLAVSSEGLASFPGMRLTRYDSEKAAYRSHTYFESYDRRRVLFLGFIENTALDPYWRMSLYDGEGTLLASKSMTTLADSLGVGTRTGRLLSSTALLGRAFFAGENTGVWACAHKSDSQFAQKYNLDDMKIGQVVFRAGVNSANWPYIEGVFRPTILCSHLSRVFFSGLSQGAPLKFDATLSADQRYLTAEFGLTNFSTVVTMTPQSIVWTDPNDPFAVGLPNFRTVPGKYPITALVSFRNSLLIFTEGDIWIMSGRFEEEFSLRQLATNVGALGHWTVTASAQAVYFADATGIYATDGEQVVRISDPVEHLFRSGTPDMFAEPRLRLPFMLKRQFGRLEFWAEREELWIPVWSVTHGCYSHCLVYNERLRQWSVYVPPQWGSAYPDIEMPCAPVPTTNGAVCFLQGRVWMANSQTAFMEDGKSGAEWVTSAARFPLYSAALSKPVLVERSQEGFVSAANVVMRKSPDNAIDSDTSTHADYTRMAIFGEEYDQDGQAQTASAYLPQAPDWALAANKAGAGKWGTAVFCRQGTVHVQRPISLRSRHVRIGLLMRSLGPVLLRGLNLLIRSVSPPGGRE